MLSALVPEANFAPRSIEATPCSTVRLLTRTPAGSCERIPFFVSAAVGPASSFSTAASTPLPRRVATTGCSPFKKETLTLTPRRSCQQPRRSRPHPQHALAFADSTNQSSPALLLWSVRRLRVSNGASRSIDRRCLPSRWQRRVLRSRYLARRLLHRTSPKGGLGTYSFDWTRHFIRPDPSPGSCYLTGRTYSRFVRRLRVSGTTGVTEMRRVLATLRASSCPSAPLRAGERLAVDSGGGTQVARKKRFGLQVSWRTPPLPASP